MSTFRWVFVEVFQICHNFNFVNMKSAVKVIFFPIKFYKKFTFMESLLQNFVISVFTLIYVPLDE